MAVAAGDVDPSYMTVATRRPLLDRNQERALSEQIARGLRAEKGERSGVRSKEDAHSILEGRAAARLLAESNLRLVISIARRYPTGTTTDFDDLIQAGNIGLLSAVRSFDGSRGYRFSTYATTWIRSAITRFIDIASPCLHIPSNSSNAVRTALGQRVGTEPLPDEILSLLGAFRAASLDAPATDTRAKHEPPDADGDARQRDVDLDVALLRLPPDHRRAVALRYGLLDDEPQSLRSISDRLGISQRQAARLVHEGLASLRTTLSEAA